MQQILIAIFVTLFYLCNFMGFGVLTCRDNQYNLRECMLIGFTVYFALFGLITLPLKLALMPLGVLSTIWVIILLIVYLFVFWKKRRQIISLATQVKYDVMENKIFYVIICGVILFEVLFVISDTNMGMHIDNSFYIGQSNTNIYTDTIDQYSPYTGEKLPWLFAKNIYNSYMAHRAVIGQIFHLAPLVEYKFSMAICVMIISKMVVLTVLFEISKRKRDILVAFLLMEMMCLFNWGYASVYKFHYWSSSDGKFSIFPFIIIPMYLLFFLKVMRDPENRFHWIMLLVITLAGDTIATTVAIISIPILGVFGIVWIIYSKSLKKVPYLILAVLPSVVIEGVYLMNHMGYLLRYIPGE